MAILWINSDALAVNDTCEIPDNESGAIDLPAMGWLYTNPALCCWIFPGWN